MVATLERRDTALPGRSLLRVNEPRAARRPHTWQRATGPVDDPYAWLRDRNDPATIEYLEAENAYADAWFGERQELLDALFDEIKSRVQETDESAPVRFGDWFYAARTVEGQSYPIHCRGRTAATASEQVLLDQNVEAEGHEFFDLGAFEVSLDHRRLAWSADVTGAEHYTLRIRDLATGDDLVDELHDSTWAGVAWSSETDYLFYVMPDEQERPYRVMRHRVGTPQQDDVEVYRDDDERFFVGIGGTRSGEWIVIQSGKRGTISQACSAAKPQSPQ